MVYKSKAQNANLWVLIKKLRLPNDVKEDLVFQYTQGRSRSTRELTASECASMTAHLRRLESDMMRNSPANRMRRKILSICHEINWRKDGKIDWKHLNEWLTKYGYLHKRLNQYTEQELPKLVTQFERLLADYYAKK